MRTQLLCDSELCLQTSVNIGVSQERHMFDLRVRPFGISKLLQFVPRLVLIMCGYVGPYREPEGKIYEKEMWSLLNLKRQQEVDSQIPRVFYKFMSAKLGRILKNTSSSHLIPSALELAVKFVF